MKLVLKVLAVILAMSVWSTQDASLSLAQTPRVLLDDEMVQVTAVKAPYTLHAGDKGAIWIASNDALQIKDKLFLEGEAQEVAAGGTVEFISATSKAGKTGELIVVQVKKLLKFDGNAGHLSIVPFDLKPGGNISDASERHKTLLIAVTGQKLKLVKNIAEETEAQWKPGKLQTMLMKAGDAQWIPEGVYRFTNLLPTKSKIIAVEW